PPGLGTHFGEEPWEDVVVQSREILAALAGNGLEDPLSHLLGLIVASPRQAKYERVGGVAQQLASRQQTPLPSHPAEDESGRSRDEGSIQVEEGGRISLTHGPGSYGGQ